MRSVLEKALHQVDTLPVKADGAPLDQRDGVVGIWRVGDALHLAVEAVSDAARFTGKFLTYEALQRRLNAKDAKPVAPDPADPRFDPLGISYDTPEEQQIARRYRYTQAQTAYERELRDYLAYAQETERLRREFPTEDGPPAVA